MEEELYKKIVICELCGQEFAITNKHNQRTKRCPECYERIYSKKQEGTHMLEMLPVKRKPNLDRLAREAKACGMSYGKYVALKRLNTWNLRRRDTILSKMQKGDKADEGDL